MGRRKQQSQGRPVRVRYRGPLQHDELVAADPEVVRLFGKVVDSRRYQRMVPRLIARERQPCVLQRERMREREAWRMLVRYLSSQEDDEL